MHYFIVVDGEARANHPWLPYFHWMRWDVQELVNARVNAAFEEAEKRRPTTSKEDMDKLDKLCISVLVEYVPASGFREYLRKLQSVHHEPQRAGAIQQKIVRDMKKYLPRLAERSKEDKKDK